LCPSRIRRSVRDASAFDATQFLGLARAAKRDPYRLSLFARHLEPDEDPLIFLPVHSGTLIVTDQRVVEFRAHLDVHGAWNVRSFEGYGIHQAWPRGAIREIEHRFQASEVTAVGSHQGEEKLLLAAEAGPVEVRVSKGYEPTLTADEFVVLRAAVLGNQAK